MREQALGESLAWLRMLDAAAVRTEAERALMQVDSTVAAVAPMVSKQGEQISRKITKQLRQMAGM
jgi:hypothetical protein